MCYIYILICKVQTYKSIQHFSHEYIRGKCASRHNKTTISIRGMFLRIAPNLPYHGRHVCFIKSAPPPPSILTNDHFTHREGYRVLLHAQYHTSNTRGLSSHKSNSRRYQAIIRVEFTGEKQGVGGGMRSLYICSPYI